MSAFAASPIRRLPFRRILGIASPVALLIAGCGGGSPSANPSNGTLTISPATVAIDTNCNGCNTSSGEQFTATLTTGGAAAVNWVLSGGDANAGPGTIDATGLYTPPSYLSSNSVPVTIRATLQASPSNSVSAIATVTPGFLQPLTPENAAVAAGSTLVVNGAIAEVGSGTINWALSTSPTTVTAPASGAGTLASNSCQHNSQAFTTCVVTYTAPATVPATIPALYVAATVNSNTYIAPLHLLLNSSGINSSGLTNQATQTGAISLGSSGGNDGDYDTDGSGNITDCCGGTLGSLIQDNVGNLYILSNNHVLAESDQAAIGTNIDQPGLIEDGCVPYGQPGSTVRPVAVLSNYVPIANASANVDVAIAKIAAGSVDPTGGVLQLGALGTGGALAAAPPAGGTGEAVTAANVGSIQVVKSGRTTGLTCSAINSVSMNISVDYYKDCAETIPYYTKTYTNQITISGNNFSDSGDSGSLVVDASNAQPVGLFYAGGTGADGSGISVANPISDVLTALSTQAATGGATFSFPANPTHPVSCINYDANTVTPASKRTVTEAALANAQAAANTSGLVNARAGILGVAAGRSIDSPGEATVIVYTDRSKGNVAVPAIVGGLRTEVIPTDAATVASGKAPTTQAAAENLTLPVATLTAAIGVKDQNWQQILKDPAFFGVGVSQSHDNPNEAALLVLVDQKRTPHSMPATVGGLRIRYLYLDRLHVSKSKYAGANHPSACEIKSILKAKEATPAEDFLNLSTPAFLHLQ